MSRPRRADADARGVGWPRAHRREAAWWIRKSASEHYAEHSTGCASGSPSWSGAAARPRAGLTGGAALPNAADAAYGGCWDEFTRGGSSSVVVASRGTAAITTPAIATNTQATITVL